MKRIFLFIQQLLTLNKQDSVITKQFTNQNNHMACIRTQAIHEVCHAVAMAMYDNKRYRDIPKKMIKLHRGKPHKDPSFQYPINEDITLQDYMVEMMICLAGFVGELEFLETNNTNAVKDLEDWHASLRLWLIHYSPKYIAETNSEAEIEWNNKIINHHKQRQTMMLRKILATNKEVIMEYVDMLISDNYMVNDDINDMLDKIIVPLAVEKEFAKILQEAKLTWH